MWQLLVTTMTSHCSRFRILCPQSRSLLLPTSTLSSLLHLRFVLFNVLAPFSLDVGRTQNFNAEIVYLFYGFPLLSYLATNFQTVKNSEYDENYRHSALEIVASFCESAPNMVKKRTPHHIPTIGKAQPDFLHNSDPTYLTRQTWAFFNGFTIKFQIFDCFILQRCFNIDYICILILVQSCVLLMTDLDDDITEWLAVDDTEEDPDEEFVFGLVLAQSP